MEEIVEIDVEILKIKDLAVLVTDGSVEAWLPLSLIIDPEEYVEGYSYTIEIPEWLAVDKELV